METGCVVEETLCKVAGILQSKYNGNSTYSLYGTRSMMHITYQKIENRKKCRVIYLFIYSKWYATGNTYQYLFLVIGIPNLSFHITLVAFFYPIIPNTVTNFTKSELTHSFPFFAARALFGHGLVVGVNKIKTFMTTVTNQIA